MESPEDAAKELRTIAHMWAADLDMSYTETLEWRAALMLEACGRALREIAAGAKDPAAIATIALMMMGAG